MMSRIDAHAMAKNTFSEDFSVQKCLTIIPDRIADNLEHGAKISVINWRDLDALKLKYMIDKAYDDRESCDYDLSRPMRRNNS